MKLAQPVLIFDTPNFAVISYGNGWEYSFIRKANPASKADAIWLQDSDALEFRAWLDKTYQQACNELLEDLWGEYKGIAEPYHNNQA
jgi:hypothetical protein